MKNIIKAFSNLQDPRKHKPRKYPFINIVVMAVSAVASGATSWYEIQYFCEAHEDWFASFLDVASGIPSHDTFNRVFSIIDPVALEGCFCEWVKESVKLKQGSTICIDGKSIRGSGERGERSFIHMVSAWCCEEGISLGQLKVHDKSNEITAVPELLDSLDITGCVVTTDAMSCQKEIVRKIIDKKANFMLAVKANQKGLLESIMETIKMTRPVLSHSVADAGHGRVEERTCRVYKNLTYLHGEWSWVGINSLVVVESLRHNKKTGQESIYTRYYISSLKPSAKAMERIIRKHWSVENNLHWTLDVEFMEDRCRKRRGNAAQNFSRLNRFAINLLKKSSIDGNNRPGVKFKRLNACWNDSERLKLIMGY